MNMKRKLCRCVVLLFLIPLLSAQDKADVNMVNRIWQEGTDRSQVMQTLSYLADVVGPRVPGTPAMKKAYDWTIKKFEEWGMKNVDWDSLEKNWRNPLGDSKKLLAKPDYYKISGYFNYDNGSGKIRGVYIQENFQVRQIFEEWMKPLRDLGVTTLALQSTDGTDHLPFDWIGIPGFQFIQDPIDYTPNLHHTNQDVYDHCVPEDLIQSAVVMATFVYHTAMREELLPRKSPPLPIEAK